MTRSIHPTIARLFDEGYSIRLFANELGSYTAIATLGGDEVSITDHFTPADALLAIAEKVYQVGAYA